MTSPEPYLLEKALWTEADFELMGWHDAFVHALAFSDPFEFALDIDYIFKWVLGKDGHYSFWIAPATLVFWNVSELSIQLEPGNGTEILDLMRESAGRPRNADYIGRDEEWKWTIECTSGDIEFRAAGYRQFIRHYPILTRQQALTLDLRGGHSFARPTDMPPNKSLERTREG
jgi:hypothetical protein